MPIITTNSTRPSATEIFTANNQDNPPPRISAPQMPVAKALISYLSGRACFMAAKTKSHIPLKIATTAGVSQSVASLVA
jgi:hypothetical protein